MPDDPAELTAAWFDAWRTKDARAIERMIAADYVYVAPNGAVMEGRRRVHYEQASPVGGVTQGSESATYSVVVPRYAPTVARSPSSRSPPVS